MKRFFLKQLVAMLTLSTLFIACDEESSDTTPPAPVSEASATAQDLSVLLSWTDPTDADLEKVVITYTDDIEYAVEVMAGEEQKTIEELTNDQSYTFTLKAVDKSGNESEEVQLTATPALKPLIIPAEEIANGTYSDEDLSGIITTYTFSGTNSLNVGLVTPNQLYDWTGTWSVQDVSITTVLENIRTNVTHTDVVSAAFCYQMNDETYYYHGAYQKVEGESDEIEGVYEYSIQSTDGGGNFSRKIVLGENGSFEYYEDDVLTESRTISSGDIRYHNFFLISYKGETFLYCDKSFVLEKE